MSKHNGTTPLETINQRLDRLEKACGMLFAERNRMEADLTVLRAKNGVTAAPYGAPPPSAPPAENNVTPLPAKPAPKVPSAETPLLDQIEVVPPEAA